MRGRCCTATRRRHGSICGRGAPLNGPGVWRGVCRCALEGGGSAGVDGSESRSRGAAAGLLRTSDPTSPYHGWLWVAAAAVPGAWSPTHSGTWRESALTVQHSFQKNSACQKKSAGNFPFVSVAVRRVYKPHPLPAARSGSPIGARAHPPTPRAHPPSRCCPKRRTSWRLMRERLPE